MVKLLGFFVVVAVCTGCVSQARPRMPEAPDPVVGDLKCVAPPMSVIDAMYRAPTPADEAAPHCENG